MEVLESEFARIGIDIDRTGNGPRLKVQDLRTGRIGYLDPLELESLIWVRHEDLAPLLDPSLTRWRARLREEDGDVEEVTESLRDTLKQLLLGPERGADNVNDR